jgi:hypothetical protein
MVWLRAAVLGRLGCESPSKSECSILPIARLYPFDVEARLEADPLSVNALVGVVAPPTPLGARLKSGRGDLS